MVGYESTSVVPRSYLYVPGNRPDRLERAPELGADAVIADLEDAVPVAAKDRARRDVGAWLRQPPRAGCEFWVRINSGSLAEDLAAVVGPSLTGVVVPKAEVGALQETDRLLTVGELEAGMPAGAVRVIALIETARGLVSAPEVAAAPRVARLGVGEADLAGELRLRPSDSREELTTLRMQITVASAAAGAGAPVGPTSTDFRDLEALRRSTEALLRLGFRGRTAIHPAQLAVLNEVFTPGPDELSAAADTVARFEAAERDGAGVATDSNGRMLDSAVVRGAREALARARTPAGGPVRDGSSRAGDNVTQG